MPGITLPELTSGTLEGTGVFDILMRANKLHLDAEFKQNRIKGAEYSTVYLGSLESIMQASLNFLLQSNKLGLEADLIAQQILLAQVEVLKAQAELALLVDQKDKIAAEILQITAQTALTNQQVINTADELLTSVAQRAMIVQQTANLLLESERLESEVAQGAQKILNMQAEVLQSTAQTELVEQQKVNLVKELDKTDAEIAKIEGDVAHQVVQTANAVIEGTVLVAQECKLRAEYDTLVSQNLKIAAEVVLLAQKNVTERAQTQTTGVDADSVIGKQKTLYQAQVDGFTRDAEQKAAKILVDTWNARRMTDEGTVADSVNMLNDATVGRVVNKVLAGVGA